MAKTKDYFKEWKQLCTFKNIIDDLANGKIPDMKLEKYDLTDEQITIIMKVSKCMGYKTIESS